MATLSQWHQQQSVDLKVLWLHAFERHHARRDLMSNRPHNVSWTRIIIM